MRKLILIFSFALFFAGTAMAQKDTVEVLGYYESNFTYGTLNAAIDDVKANGDINNTVFKLTPYEWYVLNSSIFMDVGENLEIVAPKAGDNQDSAPPQILWTEEGIDRQYIIQTFGDLTLKNVWVRYADVQGNQVSSGITFEDTVAVGQEPDKEYGIFEGVIFDYFPIGAESGGAVTVKADNFVGIFRDSYFRNGTDVHFQYYGRAVSFPYQSTGFHYDSLLFENVTFSNLSRIVMHEGNQYASSIQLNHVTLINSLEWAIQSGWHEDMSVTNSIFVNTNMLGYRPVDVCPDGADADFDDFEDGLCNPPGGGLVQDIVLADSLGFTVDYTDQDRQIYIDNNVYYHEDYLQDWYTSSPWSQARIQARENILLRFPPPAIGENAKAIYDSVDASGNKVFPLMNVNEFMDTPVNFAVPPTNQDTMLTFVMYKWDNNADVDWSYAPAAGFNQTWPLPEDMSYDNSDYLQAGWGNYPLGDLSWFPDQKASWEASQKDLDWERINNYFECGAAACTGVSNELVVDGPEGFELQQNYPNPFNPSTNIGYALPVASDISIKVYDALGREVASLFDGVQTAGSHTMTFNASNLSSGIYYYRLEAQNAGVSITRKLTLIK